MAKCEMWTVAVPMGNHVNAPMRAECQCKTHGMAGFGPTTTSSGDSEMDALCPVGKIELAVERGLEKIAAALKQPTR